MRQSKKKGVEEKKSDKVVRLLALFLLWPLAMGSDRALLLVAASLLSSTLRWACGYASGAPDAQCSAMSPQHGFLPQTSEPNVHIKILRSDDDGRVVVSLEAGSGQFRGFFLRAEDARAPEKKAMGTWWLPTNSSSAAQYVHCDSVAQSALTHSARVFSTRQVQASWQPPANFSGRVQFRATVVEDFKTYWKNIVSLPAVVKRELKRGPRQGIGHQREHGAKREDPESEQDVKLGGLAAFMPHGGGGTHVGLDGGGVDGGNGGGGVVSGHYSASSLITAICGLHLAQV